MEHAVHGSHVGNIPCGDVIVEVVLVLKQALHVCHRADIPLTNLSEFITCLLLGAWITPHVDGMADVLVREGGLWLQSTHIRCDNGISTARSNVAA